jgi:hypothetical protein
MLLLAFEAGKLPLRQFANNGLQKRRNMYKALIIIGFLLISGCASNRMYYSPFDLDRDGTMDAICPGMEYDPKEHSHYGWR